MTLDPDILLTSLRKIGIPGFAALAILAGSAWAEWVHAPTIASDTANLHAQALAERDRKAATRPVETSLATFAAIHDRLPDDRQSNSSMESVLQVAKTRGLAIDAVQFGTEPSRIPGVIRHQMQVPVYGRYDALRTWISQTLRDYPSISLDSLSIKRKDAATGDLEAQVAFSLWADTSGSTKTASAVRHGD